MAVQILLGEVRNRLRGLPDDAFDCVVTSPPYWGLRDYGVSGQIGLEPTLGEHLGVMVEVMQEVRRVLKPTGTLWLNYGDCYAASPNGRSAADQKAAGTDDRTFRDKPFSTIGGVLKPKDLCMVPNRLAIALLEDGWWVRSEIIWAKPNPMPESVKDRPATAHEKIFLLSKSERYSYDAAAVRQNGRGGELRGRDTYGGSTLGQAVPEGRRRAPRQDYEQSPGLMPAHRGLQDARERWKSDKQRGHSRRHAGFNDRWDAMDKAEQCSNGRNLRNYEPAPVQVWEVATHPFKEAHFATFPPELAERCLKAGCPKGGKVLDPFGGAGTVGLVADRMGLDCTLIELNAEYAAIAQRRIFNDAPMVADVQVLGLEAAE
jgi:DNA modification methylase